jgi:O-antigen ligase
MKKNIEIINRVIEYEIYLYIIFMFLTKGEAIRNILIFSSFGLWLATLRHRENTYILKHPVALLFWGFIGTILFSVVFSIDPLYSFKSLRGSPLKSVMMFCLLSTVLCDERRLKRVAYLTFPILVFTISVGYYSYFAYDLPLMKPVTSLRHAWHARFAMDINALLPFALVLLFMAKDFGYRALLTITTLAGISCVILSTSRGGMASFLCIVGIWLIYFVKKSQVNIKIILAGAAVILVLSAGIITSSSNITQRLSAFGKDIKTLHERTEIWTPLISAAVHKPLFGWGYGSDIFSMDKPFENTPGKKAPVHIKPPFRNPHNSFLQIFFHQGIAGLIPYILLLVAATVYFWRGAYRTAGFQSYVLMACASIMVGTFLVSSIVENPHLTDLTFILGIGVGAVNLGKGSDEEGELSVTAQSR